MVTLICVKSHVLFLMFVYMEIVSGIDEVRLLMDMKLVLDPEQAVLGSWKETKNHCATFEGVQCNSNGRVTTLSLQGKGLKGSIPDAIAGLRSLSYLYLHYNSLSGEIPRGITNLTELTDLYLNVNSLSGSIPEGIGTMPNLKVLQLCCNQLSGKIPHKFENFKKISIISLQYNQLTGAIPASLGKLSSLQRLDLSFNHIFGSIPRNVADLPSLELLNVRNNSLSGRVPRVLNRLKDGFQYSNNKALCGMGFVNLQSCIEDEPSSKTSGSLSDPAALAPRDIPGSANSSSNCTSPSCKRSSKSLLFVILFAVVAIAVGTIVSGVFAFTWYRRQKQKIGSALEPSENRLSVDHANESCRKNGTSLMSLDYPQGWDPLADGKKGIGFSQETLQSYWFNLEEVESATQHFSEVNLMSKSTSASIYKGILRDGSIVAVKSINKASCKLEEAEFMNGLNILMSLQHENLVRLRGFCCSKGRGECFLIYDFAMNGSLLQYLDAKEGSGKILDWVTRTSIINGIAKGIEYLHSNRLGKPAIVHQGISAQKIFLDQYFKPLISDSGFYKLLADDVVFSTLKSSAAMGYLAPEYTTIGRFTEKSDIYAFGVIVLQILSGKQRIPQTKCLETEDNGLLDFMDFHLHGKFSESEAKSLVKIAAMCMNSSPAERPSAQMVGEELCKCGISIC